MARINVEDCAAHVENRFALVMLAVKRARQLVAGARTLTEHTKNKPAVVALREIAAGKVGFDRDVREALSGRFDERKR
jgi:DNA-directed RNA polymerase subunit omega